MNMKKSYILSLVCAIGLCLTQIDSYAQFQYTQGDIIVNTGFGLGYWYASGSFGNFAAGLSANAEFSCILDEIAIGPYVAVTRRSYDNGNFDYDATFIDFGARGTYHFGKLLKVNNKNFDPYAGVFLGFVAVTDNYDDTYAYDAYGGRVQGGVYGGARYYFSDTFAAFGEVGVGLYPLFLGVTFKLR
jgi:hypothetical protein